tara:strand:+ start:120 stop:473 length:354 start_codon:yes stop_codon:yes gene_type:complete
LHESFGRCFKAQFGLRKDRSTLESNGLVHSSWALDEGRPHDFIPAAGPAVSVAETAENAVLSIFLPPNIRVTAPLQDAEIPSIGDGVARLLMTVHALKVESCMEVVQHVNGFPVTEQ